jgi:hypothetical protein
MDNLENQSPARKDLTEPAPLGVRPTAPPTAPHDLTELQAQYDSLSRLVNMILLLLVIVSGTLTVFLLREYKAVHRDVLIIRPRYTETVARFQQLKPKMDEFERRVSEFARTHPDFAAIVAKYAPRRPVAAAPAVPPKK